MQATDGISIQEGRTMIKTITAQEAMKMLSQGKEVSYLDLETKEIAPLVKVLESAPGVYLVEDAGEPIEITIPTTPRKTTVGDFEAVELQVAALEPEEPEERGKQGRKTNLDLGKIKALKRAGWPNYKIADEMGVSAPTISYHLKRMESEAQGD